MHCMDTQYNYIYGFVRLNVIKKDQRDDELWTKKT